ncbi:UNVERIFIED_CONTAM: hypothetical protein H355_004493 [Colinus virginianus]|nr:hypothetical protein H355_004493 [Colinus virginianus]
MRNDCTTKKREQLKNLWGSVAGFWHRSKNDETSLKTLAASVTVHRLSLAFRDERMEEEYQRYHYTSKTNVTTVKHALVIFLTLCEAVLVSSAAFACVRVLSRCREEALLTIPTFVAINTLSGYFKEFVDRQTFVMNEHANALERRSRVLLADMLPRQVLEEFRHNSLKLAYNHKCVSFLFADICGFTAWARDVDAREVLLLLQTLFSTFDRDTASLGLYKLCTIGDAYVVISEPLVENEIRRASLGYAGAEEVLQMARQMVANVQRVRHKLVIPSLEMRIGLHNGSCVGGVIGSRRLRYDLWGLDVLIGNKVESNGVAGEICCSEDYKIHLTTSYLRTHGGTVIVGPGRRDKLTYPKRRMHIYGDVHADSLSLSIFFWRGSILWSNLVSNPYVTCVYKDNILPDLDLKYAVKKQQSLWLCGTPVDYGASSSMMAKGATAPVRSKRFALLGIIRIFPVLLKGHYQCSKRHCDHGIKLMKNSSLAWSQFMRTSGCKDPWKKRKPEGIIPGPPELNSSLDRSFHVKPRKRKLQALHRSADVSLRLTPSSNTKDDVFHYARAREGYSHIQFCVFVGRVTLRG